jgi:hypothetical protein
MIPNAVSPFVIPSACSLSLQSVSLFFVSVALLILKVKSIKLLFCHLANFIHFLSYVLYQHYVF